MHSLLIDIGLDYFKRSTRVATFPYIDGAGRFLYWLRVFQVLGEWGRISKPCAVVLLKWTNGKKKCSCVVSISTLRNFFQKDTWLLSFGKRWHRIHLTGLCTEKRINFPPFSNNESFPAWLIIGRLGWSKSSLSPSLFVKVGSLLLVFKWRYSKLGYKLSLTSIPVSVFQCWL